MKAALLNTTQGPSGLEANWLQKLRTALGTSYGFAVGDSFRSKERRITPATAATSNIESATTEMSHQRGGCVARFVATNGGPSDGAARLVRTGTATGPGELAGNSRMWKFRA